MFRFSFGGGKVRLFCVPSKWCKYIDTWRPAKACHHLLNPRISMRVDGAEPQLQDVCSNESDRVILRNIIYTVWAMHRGGVSGNSYMVSTAPHVFNDGHIICLHTHTHAKIMTVRKREREREKERERGTLKRPQGYNVRRIRGRGYLVIAFFGTGYMLTLQDLQLIMDVSPLRIDCVVVRQPRDDDFSDAEVHLGTPANTGTVGATTNGGASPSSSSCSSSSALSKGPAPSMPSASASSAPVAAAAAMCITVLDASQPVQITESEVVRVRKRSRGLFSFGL
jgi:hypothetical protein